MSKSRAPIFWIAGVVGVCLLCGCCLLYPAASMMYGMVTPPNKEDVIAANAHEVKVTATDLGLNGTLMVDELSDLIAIDVATGNRIFTHRLGRDENTYAVAGPNELGTVVVLVNNMMAKRHKMMKIDLNSSKVTTIFEAKGRRALG